MKERLFYLRKKLRMNQESFGAEIELSKASISALEKGTREITERTIKLICSVYNVNEEWLRFGLGDIFLETNAISLDEYAKAKGATELEIDIIKGYLELDSSTRKMLITHFKSIIQRHDHKESDHLSIVKDESTTIAAHNDAELDDEELKRMREDLEEL